MLQRFSSQSVLFLRSFVLDLKICIFQLKKNFHKENRCMEGPSILPFFFEKFISEKKFISFLKKI